jgi:hypothetical protein
MANLVDRVKKLSVGLGIAAAIILPINSYYFSDKVTTTINDTQTKRYDKEDTYLIFTDDGVFKNTDAWYRLKFRSSDLQGKAMKYRARK